MKKIILIGLILLLTGCKDSSVLSSSCYIEETAHTLLSKTVYTFSFQNDIINSADIVYSYLDNNVSTISSIKLSIETQDKYNNYDYEVLEDNANEFKIKYIVNKESSEEMKNHFNVKEKRSDMIKYLKTQGYTCK